jgi:hypothetical protein
MEAVVPWETFLQSFGRDWSLAPQNVTTAFRDGSLYCRLCGSFSTGSPAEHVARHASELDAFLARPGAEVVDLDERRVLSLRRQGMSQRAIGWGTLLDEHSWAPFVDRGLPL